jgi:signal transduction histidine kinase
LTPPELEKGLIPGVKSMFQRIANVSSIQIKKNIIEGVEDALRMHVDEYALYRIIQEFVNNAVKHSDCTEITFNVRTENMRQISIEVADNGKGFNMHQIRNGLGLKNMDYRAKAAGLEYEFSSEIGSGTFLKIKIDF